MARSDNKDSSNSSSKAATKALTSLLSEKSNRICADCKSALVDLSQVHASFCPQGRQLLDLSASSKVCLSDFALTHQSFAPPHLQKQNTLKYGTDPAHIINQKFGGHGVFLCGDCALAHSSLPPSVAVVCPIQDEENRWTDQHATYIKNCGGNARSWIIYEHSIPDAWEKRRPGPASSLQERLLFARAKYEALSFCFPPPGPLSNDAWLRILNRHSSDFERYASLDLLRNYRHLTPSSAASKSKKNELKSDEQTSSSGRGRGDNLPNRLIDYFCVVSCSMQLDPSEMKRKQNNLSKVQSIEDLKFTPIVSDCYPSKTSRSDTELPTHLATFVLPEGCRPHVKPKPPTYFSIVLTTGEGDRLYCGVLQIWDERVDLPSIRDAVIESGCKEEDLPAALSTSNPTSDDYVFFPKCLVLMSHYGWFDLFRKVLLQLYRITLVEAPLPIERYISNVACEVPLPPQGRIKVEFGFTSDEPWTIERPPINNLPLANFSYRPLFASLSVGNIITVIGCLLEESRVVLLSKYYSILCPVAEALLSCLFPFTWQGLYIPILPYAMIDCLEAPVPFLIGLHSRYLHEIEPSRRPIGVVFVDLDRDVIHLGVDEITGLNRELPSLPSRDALKLNKTLEEFGGSPVYLIPDSGIKGCIMTGDSTLMLNEERKTYSRMENVVVKVESLGRTEIFSATDRAYRDGDLSATISGFGTVHGRLDNDDNNSAANSSRSGTKREKRKKKPFFLRVRKPASISDFEDALDQGHLLEMTEPDGFSVLEIRNAFLKFFVTLFRRYEAFLLNDNDDLFDEDDFVDDLKLNDDSPEFLQRVLQTQMFQRFLEERKDNPDHPEMRFFDESIVAKNNRSKKYVLSKGGKQPTPFLDNQLGKVTKTFTPPPPSNLGLPDDGNSYHYASFPALNDDLFGRVRPPVLWPETLGRSSGRIRMSTRALQQTEQEVVNKAMKPLLLSPAAMMAAARRSAKDLETALNSLSPSIPSTNGKDVGSGKNKKPRDIPVAVETAALSPSKKPPVSTLSRAEALILNARRKQGILLVIIVTIQACWRRHVAESKYRSFRRAIVRLQRTFRLACRVKLERLARRRRRIIMIQSLARRLMARKKKKIKLGSVELIQRWNRGRMARIRFRALRNAATTVQALARQRRAQFIYNLIRNLVCLVQARVRGMLVRRQIQVVLDQRMGVYQRNLFALWHKAHVPLSFRTKIWSVVWSSWGFLSCRVVENELIRLWKLLGVPLQAGKVTIGENGTGSSFKFKDEVYRWCMSVEDRIKQQDDAFEKSKAGIDALEYLEAERLQIYERVRSSSQDDVSNFYLYFGIQPNDAMKKAQLAIVIWTEYAHAEKSVATMLSLFRELQKESATISFVKPSARGKRRFPHVHAQTNDSLRATKALWEISSLEALVKEYNKEVATALAKKKATLAKLDDSRAKRDAVDQVRRNAVMKANGNNDWNKCRSELVRKYLTAPEMHPTQPDNKVQTNSNKSTTGKPLAVGVEVFPDIPLTEDPDPNFPDIEMTLSAHETGISDRVSFPIEI